MATDDVSLAHSQVITFGAGKHRYVRAAHRLAREIRRCHWGPVSVFGEEWLWNSKSFSSHDWSFIRTNRDTGFGCWLWKAVLIQECLDRLKDGDRLMYLDAGFEINMRSSSARRRVEHYWNVAAEQGIAAFDSGFLAVPYTKRRVLEFFDIEVSSQANQAATGAIFMVASEDTRQFIEDWVNACRHENYSLINNELDRDGEPDNFLATRWEQAIFSAQYWRLGKILLPQEAWFGDGYWSWRSRGRDFPLWAARNLRGVPRYGWIPPFSLLGWLRFVAEHAWHKLRLIPSLWRSARDLASSISRSRC